MDNNYVFIVTLFNIPRFQESALSGQSKRNESSRGGHLSDTIMTWGSDFSTLPPTGSSLRKVGFTSRSIKI